MACAECEETRKQFLEMRRAVLIFARTLNQLESDRLKKVDEARAEGAPSILELRAAIEKEAGLDVSEMLSLRESRG